MKAVRIAAGVLALSLVWPLAGNAQDGEPQEVRQQLMEEVGDATGVMGNMLRGRTEYDPQAVIEALGVIEANAAVFPDYFPEGSETGFETEALPAIWENKAEFEERSDELSSAAAELAGAVPEDMDAFAPMFQEFSRNCSGCHDDFRMSDD
ncbi:c-type cytochrome [Pararhizobium haloflavum]|uniref:c-type cytochrome n=1 Tax=Pararhizobium haloflavum TaxID=2037914 RepID=UPI000C17A132|nr:cytochrome c [Pararhizobium haloflavum]